MTAGMFATMHHHAAALRETLPTEIAYVRSFARVREPVHPESRGSREGFHAQFALIGPLAGMHASVQLQRVIRRELLAALGAEEPLRV